MGVLVSSYCCSTYRVADPFSSLGTFSSSSIRGPVIHPIADCEHPLLCLLGPGIVSQETAISGSFQQNLASVCNGVRVWMLIMGWIPGYGSLYMVHPFISAPNFVSVTPSMGVLFPNLRRGIVSTLQSSFFLSFMCFTNCILYLGYSKYPPELVSLAAYISEDGLVGHQWKERPIGRANFICLSTGEHQGQKKWE